MGRWVELGKWAGWLEDQRIIHTFLLWLAGFHSFFFSLDSPLSSSSSVLLPPFLLPLLFSPSSFLLLQRCLNSSKCINQLVLFRNYPSQFLPPLSPRLVSFGSLGSLGRPVGPGNRAMSNERCSWFTPADANVDVNDLVFILVFVFVLVLVLVLVFGLLCFCAFVFFAWVLT